MLSHVRTAVVFGAGILATAAGCGKNDQKTHSNTPADNAPMPGLVNKQDPPPQQATLPKVEPKQVVYVTPQVVGGRMLLTGPDVHIHVGNLPGAAQEANNFETATKFAISVPATGDETLVTFHGVPEKKAARIDSSEKHNQKGPLAVQPLGTPFSAATKNRWINRPKAQGDAPESVAEFARIGDTVTVKFTSSTSSSFVGSVNVNKRDGSYTFIHQGTVGSVPGVNVKP